MMDFWLGGHPGADGVLSWTTSTTAIVGIGVIAALALIVALRTGRAATSRLRWAELMLWGLSLAGLAAALVRLRRPRGDRRRGPRTRR